MYIGGLARAVGQRMYKFFKGVGWGSPSKGPTHVVILEDLLIYITIQPTYHGDDKWARTSKRTVKRKIRGIPKKKVPVKKHVPQYSHNTEINMARPAICFLVLLALWSTSCSGMLLGCVNLGGITKGSSSSSSSHRPHAPAECQCPSCCLCKRSWQW